MNVYVIRAYGCDPSYRLARRLLHELHKEYGVTVDWNNPEDLPQGKEWIEDPFYNEGKVESEKWVRAARKRVADADAVIAIVSKFLNNAGKLDEKGEMADASGLGLMGELMHFVRVPKESDPNKLIVMCIDCTPDDLVQPKGMFEQLQDEIAPFIWTRDPIMVSSRAVTNGGPDWDASLRTVAARLGVDAVPPGVATAER